jgi:hypothetical protein
MQPLVDSILSMGMAMFDEMRRMDISKNTDIETITNM